MTKTFIYGVPHGFDFYEKDTEFNDYFKGFYISSRRGRRLLINRRSNGETIYSYLCYGLKEVDRQPQHSFFGMSLVVDHCQFCPNFKILLEWFDYLFEKMVNEHNIIKKNEDGILHYVIHKFEENPSDTEWLKSNIPNILTQAGQTEILTYDSSFADGKIGLVVNFNQPVNENRLLETFKKYRWVSVSSNITDLPEDSIQTSNISPTLNLGIIELNYEELNGKLNDFNQQVLPIAVDISKGATTELTKMFDEVQEIYTNLCKYLSQISDYEEKGKFEGLKERYMSLKGNIEKLLSKISAPMSSQPVQQKASSKLGEPTILHPQSPNNGIGTKRKEKNFPKTKTCTNCKKTKPIKYFNKGEDCCKECTKFSRRISLLIQNLKKNTDYSSTLAKSLYVGIGLIIIGAILMRVIPTNMVSPGSHSDFQIKKGGETVNTKFDKTEELIDKDKLQDLIKFGDFNNVYEYVKDRKDAVQYKIYIKDAIKKHLWSIVDSSNTPKENLLKFYIENRDLLDFIDFKDEEKDAWSEVVDDYTTLWNILNQPKITKADLEKGEGILSKHSNLFPEDWIQTLHEKPQEEVPTTKDKTPDKGSSTSPTEDAVKATFTLTYTQAINGEEVTMNIDGSRIGFDGLFGTKATVTCSNGVIQENKKKSITIELKKKGKKYTINLDNKTVLTITATTRPETKTKENSTKQRKFEE